LPAPVIVLRGITSRRSARPPAHGRPVHTFPNLAHSSHQSAYSRSLVRSWGGAVGNGRSRRGTRRFTTAHAIRSSWWKCS